MLLQLTWCQRPRARPQGLLDVLPFWGEIGLLGWEVEELVNNDECITEERQEAQEDWTSRLWGEKN